MNKAFLTLWPLSGSICDLASQHGQGPGFSCQIFKYLDMKGEYIWSKESLKETDLKTQSTHGQMDWDLICSNVSPEYVGPINKNPVSKSMNNVSHRRNGRVIATKGVKRGVEPNWCWFPTGPGKDVLAKWQQHCIFNRSESRYRVVYFTGTPNFNTEVGGYQWNKSPCNLCMRKFVFVHSGFAIGWGDVQFKDDWENLTHWGGAWLRWCQHM